MKSILLAICFSAATLLPLPAQESDDIHKGNWSSWRGPLQNGSSLETYEGSGEFDPAPVWTDDIAGRGTPVIFNGRIYSWGYRGKGADLEEVVQARDEKNRKSDLGTWRSRFHLRHYLQSLLHRGACRRSSNRKCHRRHHLRSGHLLQQKTASNSGNIP